VRKPEVIKLAGQVLFMRHCENSTKFYMEKYTDKGPVIRRKWL
jgi:hypothetical protein